jgi:hypothetical protein
MKRGRGRPRSNPLDTRQERADASRAAGISVEELRKRLHYNPDTGEFRRCGKDRWGMIHPPTGSVNTNGYAYIGVNYQRYPMHRLAWFMTHGVWPTGQVDHMDGDRLNNHIANLREVSHSANQHNVAKRKRPTSSRFLGVYRCKRSGRWRAQIGLNGKQQYLGTFTSEELAYAAYLKAKAVLHPAQPIPRDSAYDNRESAQ